MPATAAGLYGQHLPQTVANFLATVRAGSFAGTIFSKVRGPCTCSVPQQRLQVQDVILPCAARDISEAQSSCFSNACGCACALASPAGSRLRHAVYEHVSSWPQHRWWQAAMSGRACRAARGLPTAHQFQKGGGENG